MQEKQTSMQQQILDNMHMVENILETQVETIMQISQFLLSSVRTGKTVYLFGNGGSASDAQHIATEFVCRFMRDRQPLPAVSLTANTAVLTAVANDYDFSQIFSRQVLALVKPGDVCVGISTSGLSSNVLEGLRSARKVGAVTIGFTGASARQMLEECDFYFQAPSNCSARIQEAHILVWHIILDFIEQSYIDNP